MGEISRYIPLCLWQNFKKFCDEKIFFFFSTLLQTYIKNVFELEPRKQERGFKLLKKE